MKKEQGPGGVEVIGRIIGIIGHRFRYEDEEKHREKWVQIMFCGGISLHTLIILNSFH